MNSIYVSFSLMSISSYLENNDTFEKNYQAVYKTIAKFLFSHSELSFTFSFLGDQFAYIKKRHPEFFVLLKEMIDRKQVEILGGGYYNPVMPLLYPIDRNGQIEMLSSEIRNATGKLPRGLSLFADCWDSSLINNCHSTGMEYVLLEETMVPNNKNKFLPIVMSEIGKSVEIYVVSNRLNPVLFETPEEFLAELINTVEKCEKKNAYVQFQPDRIVNIRFTHAQLEQLLEKKWFEKILNLIETDETYQKIKFATPSVYRKKDKTSIPYFVSHGIQSDVAKWIKHPFIESDNKNNTQFTVYDFLETYPQSKDLYNRVLYVSMLVNQFKKDRMRKKIAREKLWAAQSGIGFLCTSKGVFSNSTSRQQAYKNLMEAEKILRDSGKFTESISSFDYDGDGFNEYICRMQNYFGCIKLLGGALQELEVIKNTGNYADNFSRVAEYDGYDDGYKRGLFIDHIFTEQQFEKYIKNEPTGDGIFSKINYTELKFKKTHNEIFLCANACFGASKQQINLRKKYVINSTGMYVQYILKNESDKKLSAKFIVESNIAHTNFDLDNPYYYNLEIANDNSKININTQESALDLFKNNDLNNVNVVRITDQKNGVSFCFEPNEDCSYCYNPVYFKRPIFNSEEPVCVTMSFASSLIWDVEIEPGMEIEKTVNFSIMNVRKEKKDFKLN